MIEIYNEIQYIKNILRDGLSAHWVQDVRLLIRYYKMSGIKKSKAKEMALEKIKTGIEKQIFNFKIDKNRRDFDSIFEKAWKTTTPLRQIEGVVVSREVVDWFLHLPENFQATEDIIANLEHNNRDVKDYTHPIDWNRTKMLWTLYIWSQIQKEYLDFYISFDLTRGVKRFKYEAYIQDSFNILRNRNILYDCKLVTGNYINDNTILTFIDNFDVFKIPITEENKIFIPVGEPSFNQGKVDNLKKDLYHPGFWLECEKFGTFICQVCNNEFAHYNTTPREQARKYCKECAKKVKEPKPKRGEGAGEGITVINGVTYVSLWCQECQNNFEVIVTDNRSHLCPKCQSKRNKRMTNDRVKSLYLRRKNSVE